MQKNFTPIGATVAETSVTGEKKTQQPIDPSILTYGASAGNYIKTFRDRIFAVFCVLACIKVCPEVCF